jgi:hypothetical protein
MWVTSILALLLSQSGTPPPAATTRVAGVSTAGAQEAALTVSASACEASAALEPDTLVRVEALDSWGNPVPSVLVEGDKVLAILPTAVSVSRCVGSLSVREAGKTEVVQAPVDLASKTARLRLSGPRAATVLSVLGEFSWVYPGWRAGTQFHGSGGARLSTWRQWVHADVALKLSSFASPFWSLPGNVALDAFIGFPLSIALSSWELRASLDAGLWSTICPTVRLSLAVLRGPYVVEVGYGTHLYPVAMTSPGVRKLPQQDVPFENFIFWDLGVAVGWRFD